MKMTSAETRPSNLTAIAVLVVAWLGVSHGSIFVRLADADPLVVSAFRAGLAALVVLPAALALRWDELKGLDRRQLAFSLGAGVFLALHFAAWITSLDHTSIANSVVLVTLNPVWIAIATTAMTGRRPGGLVLASVGLAVGGAAVIGWGSAGAGPSTLYGDGLALLGGICAAGYLLLGRAVRGGGVSLLSYVAICYGTAGGLLWLMVLALGLQVTGLSTVTYQAVIAMALFSQIIGHSGYNWALKSFNPGFVAVCLLGEPVLASALGYLYFGEAVPPATWAGGPMILAGIYLGARAELGPSGRSS